MKFFAAACLLVLPSASFADSPLSNPDVWLEHLASDLLPFWDDPAAAGTPTGSFAGNLCNDGSAPIAACAGVSQFRANNPQQTLVAQSRQVFSYAIAFHMTGQQAYLDLAKAGAAYQFETFYDEATGLFDEVRDVNTGRTSGGFDSQKQAYGLLGPSFLYYLTSDPALYEQIKPIEQAITDQLRLPASGAYKFRPEHDGPANPIAKHLDQLNSYKTLLAAHVPLSDRARLQQEALQTAYYLKDAFFDSSTGTMRPELATPSASPTVDFGHSIKSFWFIDQTAQLAGDKALSAFAQRSAKALLKNAFDEDAGAWITNIGADGVRSPDAHWWGFAELNQFAASLAVEDPEIRDMLARTQAYWLEHFVDPEHKGIWGFVNIDTNEPNETYRKHWEWKAGFHSYEHALINYLAASAISKDTVELFFERSDLGDFDLAYGFFGDVTVIGDADAPGIKAAAVSNLSYAAAAPVPLPAGMVLILSGMLLLRCQRARFTG